MTTIPVPMIISMNQPATVILSHEVLSRVTMGICAPSLIPVSSLNAVGCQIFALIVFTVRMIHVIRRQANAFTLPEIIHVNSSLPVVFRAAGRIPLSVTSAVASILATKPNPA